jgi:hypothetical protein
MCSVHMELDFVSKLGSKVLDYQSDFHFWWKRFQSEILILNYTIDSFMKRNGQHHLTSNQEKKNLQTLIKGSNR